MITEEFSFDDILVLPRKSDFYIDKDFQIDISSYLTKKIKLDLPIVSSHMISVTESQMALTLAKNGGIGAVHPFMSKQKQIDEINRVNRQGLIVGATVSELGDVAMEHVNNLIKNECKVIFLDYYHAYCRPVIDLVERIKENFSHAQLVVGNVVTAQAVESLIKAGADGIKVGIGPGSHCTTRVVTGHGRPQLNAIKECSQIAHKLGVPVTADGGIKNSGDIVKAIALGADSVMIGSLLAGSEQTPGEIIIKNGKKYKQSWGSCADYTQSKKWSKQSPKLSQKISKIFAMGLGFSDSSSEDKEIFEEGTAGLIEYKGDANMVLKRLEKGLRRGLWYSGAKSISEFQNNCEIVLVSPSTIRENYPSI